MQTNPNSYFSFDELKVFFKHTTYHGFVHPYNFLEWTSYVREAFFAQHCPDFEAILISPIKMMTTKISADYLGESKFGDRLQARFTSTKIKKVSFDVIVRFMNTQSAQKICQTYHSLVFVDSLTGKFTSIPQSIKEAVSKYQEPD